jgi:hypothetical protein
VYVPNPDSWNIRPSSDQTIFKWLNQYSSGYDKVFALDTTTALSKGGKPVKTTNADVVVYERKASGS